MSFGLVKSDYCKKNLQLCYYAILNVELHCSSIVKPKNIILFFFTFCFLSLSVLFQRFSFTLSLSQSSSLLSPHSFSHVTSLFLVQSLHQSWVRFMVTAQRLAWILDFGSAWIDGDRRSWWIVFGLVSCVGRGSSGGFGVVGQVMGLDRWIGVSWVWIGGDWWVSRWVAWWLFYLLIYLWLVLGVEGCQECCKMEFWFRWDFGGQWAMVAWWAWWCCGGD